MQRYIVILLFFAIVVAVFGLGDNDKPVDKGPKVVKAPPGHEMDFEYLSEPKKKAVEKLYEELSSDIQAKEYQKARDVAPRILSLTNDYKDTKEYQRMANDAIEKAERAQKEKEKKEAQDRLRKEIEAMEERGKALYEKALADPKYRGELQQLIQEIYSKDPNDHFASDWQAGIAAKLEEEKKAQAAAEAKEVLHKKAEAAFDAVVAIFKNEEYISALAEAEKLGQVGYSEKPYLDKVADLKTQIRDKLHSVIDPLIKEAADQSKEGGNLVRAKDLYMQVLKIDTTNPVAQKGLDAIREVLHNRAKRYYAEAVLAESVSDLNEAKDKFALCEKSSPDDDAYKARCHTKLMRFGAFTSDSEQK
jgi:hypothetical protein